MAPNGCMNRVFGVLLVTVALMVHCGTAQTTHIVGGSTGWALPSDPTSYSTWASQQTFRVGDSLTFNFATSRHDVATVSEAAYDACDASSPIGPVQSAGPVTISLNTPGPIYYICSFEGHCRSGQKISVSVVAAASPPTTPTTTSSPPPPTVASTPPTTTGNPPSTSTVPSPTAGGPSSRPAPTLAFAGLFATFFSFAVALSL